MPRIKTRKEEKSAAKMAFVTVESDRDDCDVREEGKRGLREV